MIQLTRRSLTEISQPRTRYPRVKLVFAFLLVPSLAHARDPLELVCSGVAMKPADGGEQIALFFHFFESRANDGTSRDEYLSTIYQGRLFKGHYLNKHNKRNTAIVLKNAARVRFDGTYAVDNKQATGPYTIHIVGTIHMDPSDNKGNYRAVDETLPCTDISI